MTRDATHDGAAVKAKNLNLTTENRTRTGPAGNLSDWPPQYNRSGPGEAEFYPLANDVTSVVLTILKAYLGIGTPCRQWPSALPIAQKWNLAMTTFDKREEGFEKKFVLDEELKFKADARRNKLLGLWVAEKLGLTGEAANAYAKDVVAADADRAGGAADKVTTDLAEKGVAMPEAQLRTKMDQLMAEAIAQVKAGK